MREMIGKKLLIVASFFVLVGILAAPAFAQCVGDPQNVVWNGWSFQFIRPCKTQTTTSGGNGGGIELRNGVFNGKQVFFKLHTPILNVRYQGDACGPYRDWQYQESNFQCVGTVVAGQGRCNGAAVTNCNNPPGGDVGSFTGVAVDTSSPDYLVLTTVLSAGWYRYQLEYYFYANGALRPAVKWTGVPNPCLNNSHLHSIFWRIDFDIEGSANNEIAEFNDPPLSPGYTFNYPWDILFTEQARMKDTALSRFWRQRNRGTNRAYLVYSPETYTALFGPLPPFGIGNVDGVAVPFQRQDIWGLLYNGALQEETNDCAGTPALCTLTTGVWPHLDRFVDQTSDINQMVGQDLVFWYSASHAHPGSPTAPACDEVNGPYLTPDPDGPAW
ncbi:MAG: hypothetical protein HYR55_09075 [Acidobacteria bacterium]|nr:hypothetical protein [Acidobacteriota bacterium]MBI3655157.1 hypothetical protein [Acidobacteriota bacterium]